MTSSASHLLGDLFGHCCVVEHCVSEKPSVICCGLTLAHARRIGLIHRGLEALDLGVDSQQRRGASLLGCCGKGLP
eukprot:8787706-Pyramimonas_sp.AAC.2